MVSLPKRFHGVVCPVQGAPQADSWGGLHTLIHVIHLCVVKGWFRFLHMGVSKNRGVSPNMDGENNGNPY